MSIANQTGICKPRVDDPHIEQRLDEILQSGQQAKIAQHIALVIHALSGGANVFNGTVADLAAITGWGTETIKRSLLDLEGVVAIQRTIISPSGKSPSSHKALLRQSTIEAFGHTCAHCELLGTDLLGPDGRPWCLDRIIPGAAGGLYEPGNVTLSCWACNSQRGASPIERRVFSTADWLALQEQWQDVGVAMDMEALHV